MTEITKMIQDDYGIKKKLISKRIPQTNVIVEKVNQTIGNLLKSFEVQYMDALNKNDPCSGITSAISFAVRATLHTTARATPIQLVFGRDTMLKIPFLINWKYN